MRCRPAWGGRRTPPNVSFRRRHPSRPLDESGRSDAVVVNVPPLVDRNKRLGWLAAAGFLEVNGVPASVANNDAVYDLVQSAAAAAPKVEGIAVGLRTICSDARQTGSIERATEVQPPWPLDMRLDGARSGFLCRGGAR